MKSIRTRLAVQPYVKETSAAIVIALDVKSPIYA
jgi:hypothetical protein